MPTRPPHTCHVPDCNVSVAPRFLMCGPHWAVVPKTLQRAVLQRYRPGQEIDKSPSPEYLEAARAAINEVAKLNQEGLP
jgi:hypothetical protein